MSGSKVTFMYHDNLGGFSESWIDNANAPTNYPVVALGNYLKARMGMSGFQTTWDFIRVSDGDPTPATSRKVNVFFPDDPRLTAQNIPVNGQYTEGRANRAQTSDFAGTRFLVRKQSTDLSQARVFLAGFPDNQCENGGQYTPTGPFLVAFNAWIAAIKANIYGWNSYAGPTAALRGSLTNMVTGADNRCTITVTPGAGNPPFFQGIAVGTHLVVRISSQWQPRNANGSHTVIVTADNTCITVKPLSISNFVVGFGTVSRRPTRTFKALDIAIVDRVVKRGPGRPFGLYRGRGPVIARG